MDTRSRHEIRIGLLVVAGLTALVVLVLLSDRISFDPGYRITVKMRDAGGLNAGSPVKLSGVQIGTVRSIVADSQGTIEAVINIDSQYQLTESMPLQLASQGIFGDGFLSFAAPKRSPDRPIATDGSAVLQADSTFFEQVSEQADSILTGISELLASEQRGHIATILSNGAAFSQEAVLIAQEWRQQREQIDGLMLDVRALVQGVNANQQVLSSELNTRLQQSGATMAALTNATTAVTADSRETMATLDQLLLRLDGLAQRGDDMLSQAQQPMQASLQQTQATIGQLQQLLAAVANGQGLLGQLLTNDAMAQDVNETLITANQLVERVADQPEILIWGSAEADTAAARDRRRAAQQRRAFMEGYGRRLDQQLPAATDPVSPPTTQPSDADSGE